MDFNLPIVAPSILAADFTHLKSDIDNAIKGGANWIHCDIMDGNFVPNISFGPSIVKQVDKIAPDAFIDVHLMVDHPEDFIEDFVNAGADMLTVHYEVAPHLHKVIQEVKKYGIMVGVAINPATSLHNIEPILSDVDLVLIMTVNPGFGGQSFIENSYQRIQELVDIRELNGHNFLIEIDGGVNLKNIGKIAAAGAEVLVAGSAVFKANDIPARVKELQAKIKS